MRIFEPDSIPPGGQNIYEKYKEEYSDKTLLLMQVGSFFECYAILNEKENMYNGSNIQEFSDINDLVISRKNASHEGKPVPRRSLS